METGQFSEIRRLSILFMQMRPLNRQRSAVCHLRRTVLVSKARASWETLLMSPLVAPGRNAISSCLFIRLFLSSL